MIEKEWNYCYQMICYIFSRRDINNYKNEELMETKMTLEIRKGDMIFNELVLIVRAWVTGKT